MPPKRRPVDHVQDGEVILVDKQAVLPQKVLELTHRQAEKLRPKTVRTQAQIENTKRLVELNKKRAQEWKSRTNVVSIPPSEQKDEIPVEEDKIAVKVKPKRKYDRKIPHWNSSSLDQPAPVPQPAPTPAPQPQVRRTRQIVVQDSESEEDYESEEEDLPQPLPVKKKAPTKLKKSGSRVRSRYHDTTSESETTDTDSDMERVAKYVKKASVRMDAVKAIDERLKAVSNKYVAAGLSVF
jgi:hypothetical protein